MTQTLLAFLGHGGFKLLIFAFVVIGQVMKSRAKAAREREAELRGPTAISDFSTPEPAPDIKTPDIQTAPPAPLPAPKSKGSNSAPDSPWSQNQNPFDS